MQSLYKLINLPFSAKDLNYLPTSSKQEHSFLHTMLRSNSLQMMIINTFLLILLLLPVDLTSAITTSPSSSNARPFSKIFAFGDSFTDTGNTHSATGPYSFGYVSSPPYGVTFFHRSTNRYSDGRLVIDFLASRLSLPFLPAYLRRGADFSHGVNFAVAGSTAIEHEFFVKNNMTLDITPQSLMTQLWWFETYLEKEKEGSRLLEDALFWVGEIGVNDYAYSFMSSVPGDQIMKLAVNKVSNFLQALLERGAKYIVVQGMPLIGCLPLTMTLATPDDRDNIGCVASANKQAYKQNLLLQGKLQELGRRYPNATISYADYFAAYHAVMKNLTAHGFSEPFRVCCGSGNSPYHFDLFATCGSPSVHKACSNPSKFVNWDGVHLTEAMYKVIADLFFHHDYCRPSFKVLLNAKE